MVSRFRDLLDTSSVLEHFLNSLLFMTLSDPAKPNYCTRVEIVFRAFGHWNYPSVYANSS